MDENIIVDFKFIVKEYDVHPVAAEIFEGMIVKSYKQGFVEGAFVGLNDKNDKNEEKEA